MKKSPKILMVWPDNIISTSNLQYSAKFSGCKTYVCSYGLCTVAGYLPDSWDIKLIDVNVDKLTDKLIDWCDYLFLSGTCTQEDSILKISRRVANRGKYVILGGNYVTTFYDNVKDEPSIDTFCLNECEPYIDELVEDINNGTVKHVYGTEAQKLDMALQKTPRLSLLKDRINSFLNVGIQISRGCNNQCEFCSITVNHGRKPRYKNAEQVVEELEQYYQMGWRGSIWVVDDNFIMNIRKAKDILLEIGKWQKKRNYPFILNMQIPLNISEEDELIAAFKQANFKQFFCGIESINEESLKETKKYQNVVDGLSINERIRKLIREGFEIMGALIIGFDCDHEKVFQQNIDFLNETEIPWCDIYLLVAVNGTQLYKRLIKDDRIITDKRPGGIHYFAEHYGVTNFRTVLDPNLIQNGYAKLLQEVNSPQNIYRRLKGMLMLQPKESIENLPFYSDSFSFSNLMLILKTFLLFPNRISLLKYSLQLKKHGDWLFYKFFYSIGNYYNSIYVTPKIIRNIKKNRVDKNGCFPMSKHLLPDAGVRQ